MKQKSLTRVLALDLLPRRFGYVVLEGPERLLDWGVRSYRRTGKPIDALIHRRLRPLLELWRPMVLVIHAARQVPPRKKLLRERLLKAVVAEAKNNRVCVRILKSAKEQAEKLTKYERAREVAKRFPVLARSLPAKRKPWQSEDHRMGMFAAAALAMAQLNITALSAPAIPEPLASPFDPPRDYFQPTKQVSNHL